MNLSRLFILRPVATSLLMVALLLSGLLAYRWLPVASLPQVSLHAWAGLFLRIRRTLYMRLASLPLAPPRTAALHPLRLY